MGSENKVPVDATSHVADGAQSPKGSFFAFFVPRLPFLLTDPASITPLKIAMQTSLVAHSMKTQQHEGKQNSETETFATHRSVQV